MKLELDKLENLRSCGGKWIARCPACAEAGHDRSGNHLCVFDDGRFGCVANPGEAGQEHRKRIFALVGDRGCTSPPCVTMRVRPSPHRKWDGWDGLIPPTQEE